VIERLTAAQSSQLLLTYRETFSAENHGEAVKAMYSRFEAAFGVSRNTLRAEVMRDRREHPKEYRKLQQQLITRATKAGATGARKSVSTATKVEGKKSDQSAPRREGPQEQIVSCPACGQQFRTPVIPRHRSGGRRCKGSLRKHPSSSAASTPSMATTLAKWNIELEPAYERPRRQQIHRLVVNFDAGSWQVSGVLSEMGYHVGKNGPDKRTRRAILTEVFKVRLVAASPDYAAYVSEWGAPMSRTRLSKMMNSISSFARIRRSSKADCSGAIADWDSDLAWLKTAFKV
jgi:hypothetical protein